VQPVSKHLTNRTQGMCNMSINCGEFLVRVEEEWHELLTAICCGLEYLLYVRQWFAPSAWHTGIYGLR